MRRRRARTQGLRSESILGSRQLIHIHTTDAAIPTIRTTGIIGRPFTSDRHSIGITDTVFIILDGIIGITIIGTRPSRAWIFRAGGVKTRRLYFLGEPDVAGADVDPVTAEGS